MVTRVLIVAGIAILAAMGNGKALGAARVAFIDVGRTPLGALIEAKLLENQKVQWVERDQIDNIRAEQRLQAAFTPAGVDARLALGKVLKADMLVLLRAHVPAVASQPGNIIETAYDLIVCESRRGLRLSSRLIVETKDQPVDVTAVAGLVQTWLSRAGQELRMICTVPPLLTRDISYRYSYLQQAYADFIIQHLLDQPGVAVIEIAEARAIAAERALVGQTPGLKPLASIFITGEFRHLDGQTGRVQLKLSALRGEQLLGRVYEREMPQTEVVKELTAWTDSLVRGTARMATAPSNPASDAEKLRQRSLDYAQVGSFDESWNLAEAGLLIQPDELKLRRQAFSAASRVAQSYLRGRYVSDNLWPPLQASLSRATEHLEFLAAHDGPMSINMSSTADWISSPVGRLRKTSPQLNAAHRALFDELCREEEAALLRMYRVRMTRKLYVDAFWFMDRRVGPFSAERLKTTIVEAALELPDVPEAPRMAYSLVNQPFAFTNREPSLKLEIYREVEKRSPLPAVVKEMQKQVAVTELAIKDQRANAIDVDGKPWADVRSAGVLFPLLDVKVRRSVSGGVKLEPLTERNSQIQTLPLGPQLDLVWHRTEAFLMNEPGILDPIWRTNQTWEDAGAVGESACFDGRYAWIVVDPDLRGERRLLVIDPASRKTWVSPSNFGLPWVNVAELRARRVVQDLRIAPIGPGEVCAVSSAGPAVVARIRFAHDQPDPFVTQILLECPEEIDVRDREAWRNTKARFKPGYLQSVPDPAQGSGPAEAILIERSTTATSLREHPLVLNVATNRIEPVPDRILAYRVSAVGKQIHFQEPRSYSPARTEWFTLDFPSLRKTRIAEDVPPGMIFKSDKEFHIVGLQWWSGVPDSPLRVVADRVPWYSSIFNGATDSRYTVNDPRRESERPYVFMGFSRSAHYGLVIRVTYEISPGKNRYFALRSAIPWQ